jgi:hypothetical protein
VHAGFQDVKKRMHTWLQGQPQTYFSDLIRIFKINSFYFFNYPHIKLSSEGTAGRNYHLTVRPAYDFFETKLI